MYKRQGYTVWQALENYIKEKERARGYLHVMTPCIGTVNLYKTSGHWDHYRENMFPAMEMEGESYVLRPMNCPHPVSYTHLVGILAMPPNTTLKMIVVISGFRMIHAGPRIVCLYSTVKEMCIRDRR